MTYISNNQGYTYGVKSLTDIDSISGMVEGENVFCSDNFKVMTYDGDLWMCSDFIKLTNGSGSTLSRGDVVIAKVSTANTCTTTTTSQDEKVLGVVVFGATDTNPVAIAWQGIYDIDIADSTNNGDMIETSTTAGSATSGVGATAGSFAVAVETIGAAGLCRCVIWTKVEYF